MAIRSISGPGLMAGGDRNNPLSDAQIRHSKIKHITIRDRWHRLNPSKGKFNFDYLKSQIERCIKAKKPYVIGVMTGVDCSPGWITKSRIQSNKGPVIPPWLLSLAGYYNDLHAALSRQLQPFFDPYFCQIWITGPTVPSQEMHTNGIHTASGFSPDRMQSAWIDAIDVMDRYYKDVSLVLSISGQRPVQAYLQNVIDYAIKILGDRAVFQFNSLGTQTSLSATHVKKAKQLHDAGRRVGAEMVQPGHTAALKKLPWLDFQVLYPGDEQRL